MNLHLYYVLASEDPTFDSGRRESDWEFWQYLYNHGEVLSLNGRTLLRPSNIPRTRHWIAEQDFSVLEKDRLLNLLNRLEGEESLWLGVSR